MAFIRYNDSQKKHANQYVKKIQENFRTSKHYTLSAHRTKQWQHLQNELNTKSELMEKAIQEGISPDEQETLSNMFFEPFKKTILSALTPQEREYAQQIPVGFVPTGDMNATAFKTPSGVPAILFDIHGLARFINVFNKISFYTEEYNDKTIRDLVVKNVDCLINPTKTFFKTPEHKDYFTIMLTSSFTMTQELFITAHEYSHILCGHLNNERVIKRKLFFMDTQLDEYELQREFEFEADARAYNICERIFNGEIKNPEEGAEKVFGYINQINPDLLKTILVSIEVFFLYLELMEKISKIPLSGSHPTARQRRERIHQLRTFNMGHSLDFAQLYEDFYFMKIFPEFSSQEFPETRKKKTSKFSKIFKKKQKREEMLSTESCLFCGFMRMEFDDEQKKAMAGADAVCPICNTAWKEVFKHEDSERQKRLILKTFKDGFIE